MARRGYAGEFRIQVPVYRIGTMPRRDGGGSRQEELLDETIDRLRDDYNLELFMIETPLKIFWVALPPHNLKAFTSAWGSGLVEEISCPLPWTDPNFVDWETSLNAGPSRSTPVSK